MKKNTAILFSFICGTASLYAQHVGINTTENNGKFMVKPAKPDTAKVEFVVKHDGKVGIGEIDPATKLHVKAKNGEAFRLFDGTQGNGKILVSTNKEGDAQWKGVEKGVLGSFGNGATTPVTNKNVNTTAQITLPPGKWLIRVTLLVPPNRQENDGFLATFILGEQNGGNFSKTSDVKMGNRISGVVRGSYGVALGQMILDNASGASKTYFILTDGIIGTSSASYDRVGSSFWGENSFMALAITEF